MNKPTLLTISFLLVPVFAFSFTATARAEEPAPSATPAPGTLVPSAEDLKALENLATPSDSDSQTLNQLQSSNSGIQFFPGGEATLSPELQQKLADLQNATCTVPWWRYAIDVCVGLGAAIIFWVITRLVKMKKQDKPNSGEKH